MLEYLTKEDLPEGVVDVVDVIGMDAFKSLNIEYNLINLEK